MKEKAQEIIKKAKETDNLILSLSVVIGFIAGILGKDISIDAIQNLLNAIANMVS